METLREEFVGMDHIFELKESDSNSAERETVAYAIQKALKVYREIYN